MISDNIIYFFYDLGGTWEGRQKIKKAIFFFGGGRLVPPFAPSQSDSVTNRLGKSWRGMLRATEHHDIEGTGIFA